MQADRVMQKFRARFGGKVSPVHFFWGSMDLASTRFSGREAPVHPGGAPSCGDWVLEEGAFYAYAYPEPEGFADYPVDVEGAFYSQEGGQFLLPYEAVRTAPDPDKALLDFLQFTYEAAADRGSWDRSALQADPSRLGSPTLTQMSRLSARASAQRGRSRAGSRTEIARFRLPLAAPGAVHPGPQGCAHPLLLGRGRATQPGIHKLSHAPAAEFASEARSLDATKRQPGKGRAVLIDVCHPYFELIGDLLSTGDV